MTNESEQAAATPSIGIRYFFLHCNDLLAMRCFYSDLLGMQETAYRNDEQGAWLCYKCEGFEFMIFPAEQAMPVQTKFALQPGWGGGTQTAVSWSVWIPDGQFAAVVQRLQAAGGPAHAAQPQWAQDSYWSFPVLDPMGNTVELYSEPQTRPGTTSWPG